MKWYNLTPEECPWVAEVLERRREYDKQWSNYQVIRIYTGPLHGREALSDWLYQQYEESHDPAWLDLGNKILKEYK
jgi:hypothetical protein